MMTTERYKPSFLREKGIVDEDLPIRYGIGIENGPKEFRMIHGPFETVEECLEIGGPSDRKINIFILEVPSNKKLWKWIAEDQEWERYTIEAFINRLGI